MNDNIILSSVSIPDLVDMIADKVQSRLAPQPNNPDRYLTVKETCSYLGIDASTIYRWQKRGYLVPVKMGGLLRYKFSDISNILEHDPA